MQDKENVCVEKAETEQGSVIQSAESAEKRMIGSTDLGKFKDVNALKQAYESLQAEFTRRSQRLKRYEQEEENQRRQTEKNAVGCNAECDRTDAYEQDGQGPSFAEEESLSVAETDVKTDANVDVEKERMEMAELVDGGEVTKKVNQTATNVDGTAFTGNVADIDAPSLYEQVMANEEVRLRIVGEYLSSIGKSGAPLVKGGTGVMTTPPKRPSSISEAGKMALVYLKTRKESL